VACGNRVTVLRVGLVAAAAARGMAAPVRERSVAHLSAPNLSFMAGSQTNSAVGSQSNREKGATG
jgi:hypothetical protein